MALSWFLSLLIFLWIAAITPGPNNILLTTSTANFGVKRTLPLMSGIIAGMQLLLLLVAAGVGSVILTYPGFHLALKIAGSVYLVWLAWKTATARYQKLNVNLSAVQPVRLFQGLLLQALNPKAWLMSIGSVASFSLVGNQYVMSVVAISIAMFAVNLVAGFIWMGFGAVISRLLTRPQAWLRFNVAMGLLTAGCVILIWL